MITSQSPLTVEQLESLPVPTFRAGAHWRPLPNGELVGALLVEAKNRRWRVGEPQGHAERQGADVIVSARLALPGVPPPRGTSFAVAILNAHGLSPQRNSLGLRLYGGLYLHAEGAGVPFRMYKLGRHTFALNVEEALHGELDHFQKDCPLWNMEIEELRGLSLDKSQAMELITEAARRNLIPWSHARFFGAYSDNPKRVPGNRWELLREFTAVCKRYSPIKQMGKVLTFHHLLKGKDG